MLKRVASIVVMATMVILCIIIWPLKLVRKEAVYWTQSVQYEESALQVGEEAVMEQLFVAQESFLSQVAFVVTFIGEECKVAFEVRELGGKSIYDAELTILQEDSSRFVYVDVDKWIKKGREYALCVKSLSTEVSEVQFVYTPAGEATAKGNAELRIGNQIYDGCAVTSYTYREPLNYKNIVCIWAAILAMGFSFLGILRSKERRWEKCIENGLEKMQIPILIAEMALCVLMLVKASFTVAVDWDEAYTWRMVTQNTVWEMMNETAADVHPPLYYMLVMLAVGLFGESAFVIRMVSVAGALVSMLFCATIVRKRWGIKVAVPMILVLGLGPQFAFYNLNLRMYSWMVAFVFAAGLAAYEVVCTDRRKYWILLAVATLGGLYTQYFAVVPLLLIYAYLMVYCIWNKRIKGFVLHCATVVAIYIPQVFVIIRMLMRDHASLNEEMPATLNVAEFCSWSFQTNIKWSEYLPFVLYIVAIILLVIQWKSTEKKERGFRVLTVIVCPLTWVMCYLVSNNMNHFWHNRYLLPALLYIWFFVTILYSKQNFKVWCCFLVWLGISVMSSYVVVKSAEDATISYIEDTQRKLECVQEEEIVIYNFPSYNVIYEYYVPDAEFIWIEDVDFSGISQDYVYMIAWGGLSFEQDVVEKYKILVEYIYPFRLEEGIDGVYLCKVSFQK